MSRWKPSPLPHLLSHNHPISQVPVPVKLLGLKTLKSSVTFSFILFIQPIGRCWLCLENTRSLASFCGGPVLQLPHVCSCPPACCCLWVTLSTAAGGPAQTCWVVTLRPSRLEQSCSPANRAEQREWAKLFLPSMVSLVLFHDVS